MLDWSDRCTKWLGDTKAEVETSRRRYATTPSGINDPRPEIRFGGLASFRTGVTSEGLRQSSAEVEAAKMTNRLIGPFGAQSKIVMQEQWEIGVYRDLMVEACVIV